MSIRSQVKDHGTRAERLESSALWRLVASSLLVAAVTVTLVQFALLMPWIAQRMNLERLVAGVIEDLPWILLLAVMVAPSILRSLQSSQRSRPKSERTVEIEPATIDHPKDNSPVLAAFNAALDRLETGRQTRPDVLAQRRQSIEPASRR